ELPVALLGADKGAHLAHASLVEGQGASQLEIEHLEHRRIRPSPPCGRERNFNHRGGWKHWQFFNRVVADPRQHLLVQMVEPAWDWALLTKTEKRMIEWRICRIGGLDRHLEPKSLPIPRVEWKAARISWPVKARCRGQVITCYVAFRGYGGEGIIIQRF